MSVCAAVSQMERLSTVCKLKINRKQDNSQRNKADVLNPTWFSSVCSPSSPDGFNCSFLLLLKLWQKSKLHQVFQWSHPTRVGTDFTQERPKCHSWATAPFTFHIRLFFEQRKPSGLKGPLKLNWIKLKDNKNTRCRNSTRIVLFCDVFGDQTQQSPHQSWRFLPCLLNPPITGRCNPRGRDA